MDLALEEASTAASFAEYVYKFMTHFFSLESHELSHIFHFYLFIFLVGEDKKSFMMYSELTYLS